LTTNVTCPYSIEDLALTHATSCKLCGRSVREHERKLNLALTKSPKIPKESELPVFRDPAKKEMAEQDAKNPDTTQAKVNRMIKSVKPEEKRKGGAVGYKAGGKVSSASKRADGCAIRGKTRA
jgi:hypothetical protein